jgi:ribonuclease E
VALHILRSVEETLIRSATHNLCVRTRAEVAFYILNQKRTHLRELESRFGVTISVMADEHLGGATTFALDRLEPALKVEHKPPAAGVRMEAIAPIDEAAEVGEIDEEHEGEDTGEEARDADEAQAEAGEGDGRRRRRRRRRRGRNGEFRDELRATESEDGGPPEEIPEGEHEGAEEGEAAEAAEGASGEPRLHRGERDERRGRRGRRGRGRDRDRGERGPRPIEIREHRFSEDEARSEAATAEAPSAPSGEARFEEREAVERAPVAEEPRAAAPPSANGADEEAARPTEERSPAAPEPEPVAVVLTPPDPDRPKRAGWWSKAKAVISGG